TGALVLEARSVRLEELETARLSTAVSDLDGLFTLEWVPVTPSETATPVTSVAVLGEGPFTVPGATTHADTAALLAALDAGAPLPQCAVLTIASAPDTTDTPAAAQAVVEDLLLTVQTWLTDDRLEGVRLLVVTRGAVTTSDHAGVTDLPASTAWGLIRTAQTEHPDRFVLLDTDTTDLDWNTALTHTSEPQLALHEGQFLAPRLKRGAPRQDGVVLDPAGTVLVTGGTEGLGREVARHLVARHGVRHLVLTGDDGEAQELRDELGALGAQVTFADGDPADRAAMAQLLAGIPAERPLTGVVHTVGEDTGGLLETLTADRLGALLDARVRGAVVLDELTRNLDLSAFVVFSSAAGVLGGAGYAGPAAAGSFLDALAQRRRDLGQPGLSIAWGALRTEAGADAARLSREGAVALPVEESLALFDASLLSDTALTVATRVDVQVLRERAMAGVLSPVWSGLVRTPLRRAAASEGPAGLSLARRLLGLSKAERNRAVLDLVRGHVATILGYEGPARVDETKGFLDAGVDSLTAVELRNRLSAATGLQLPATLVFDHPTPVALAQYVLEEVLGGAAGALQQTGPTTAVDVTEPIAVVGIACRFPGGVRSPEDLWDLVAAGLDATGDFPADRGWAEDLYDPDPEHFGTSYVRRGGFLDDVAGFDAEFFGISPREALAMDPQQRLLLEASWEAMERAGLDPQALKGSPTGVYVGAGSSSYICDMEGLPDSVEGYAFTGNTSSVLSGRVSYTFGFEGPAVSVDTACSSSLVALHLAVQALRQGECTLALAGGVTVLAGAGGFIEFSRQRALSPDGRCKPFSADADGTAWAEGVGMLALERLSDARRAGHRILGVIRGSAINQDGASSGLTAPNGPSQQRVIRAALANAGLSAGDVDAVEAHGTGTKLGDPIEAQALIATYGQDRPTDQPVRLGSFKSNIGHSVAAAGVGGVIKMLMALQHEELPRTLNVSEPSPFVDWSAGALELLTEPVAWPRGTRARRAAVSSFGASGTNAHLIVEEAPEEQPEPGAAGRPSPVPAGSPVPWLLGAGSAGGLVTQAGALASFVRETDADPAAVARALLGRSGLRHRVAVVGDDREALLAALDDVVASGPAAVGAVSGQAAPQRVALVFPGQGWQWLGMGRELLTLSPVFADLVGEVSALVEELAGWSLLDVLTGAPEAQDVDRVDVIQPVMFTVMVGLARLWESLGVCPDAVVGHSQGEIAAACVAGILSLEDAVRIVVTRSAAITAIAGGGTMLSVAAPVTEAAKALEPWTGRLWVAAVNGPSSTVVAGDLEAALEFMASAQEHGPRVRRIPVDYASHSPHVEAVRQQIIDGLTGLTPSAGRIPMYSTVTGELADGASMDGAYWYHNLREPVRFEEATCALLDDGITVFVEASAHPVLTTGIAETAEERGTAGVTVTGTLRRDEGGLRRLQTSAAQLWAAGVELDWDTIVPVAEPVELPTYAFDRRRYWLERTSQAGQGDLGRVGLTALEHGLLAAGVEVAGEGTIVLSGRISTATHPWLADHAVAGTVIVPGTAYVDLAIRAGDQAGCPLVEELLIQQPLILPDGTAAEIQVVVDPAGEDGRRTAAVLSRPHGGGGVWTRHAQATLAPDTLGADDVDFTQLSGAWPPRGAVAVPVDSLYADLAERGYHYGPVFQGLRSVWRSADPSVLFAEVALPEQAEEDAARFGLHPALLDAALHAQRFHEGFAAEGVWLPFTWNRVSLLATGAATIRVLLRSTGEDTVRVAAADPAGAPVALVEAMRLRKVDPSRLSGGTPDLDGLFALEWFPVASKEAAVPVVSVAVLGEGPFTVPGATTHADTAALLAALD
ncbi:type I polyketide synthase, partial [Streptomyces sp. CC219B]|uniref:type I polyketide synthase n=1 Tax=Streptomyces sp. CC219B TaxID=3044574 RepID=UPI0024A96F86